MQQILQTCWHIGFRLKEILHAKYKYQISRMQNSGEQFRAKRQQFASEIRRQNREQILAKRRNINAQATEEQAQKNTNSSQHIIDPRFAQKIKQFHAQPAQRDKFMEYLTAIHDPDMLNQHYGIIQIRKLLTQKKNPPIQQVIDAGLIPKLIAYAKQSDYPQMQLEAVWCLTNVAAGNNNQTGSIIEKGGLKIFIDLLLSPHVGIVEQAIWALGNIACDSPGFRDMIVKNGGHKNLIKVIEVAVSELPRNPAMQEIIQSATWSLSGICRIQPLPNYLLIKEALPVFFYVVKNNLIKELAILGNICWAISYYTNKQKQGPTKIDKIQACIDSGVLPQIIQYLGSSYDNLVVACLKIVGNIANGNHQQTEYLIGCGVIEKLQQLLGKPKKVYRRDSCWVLSNLTAGSAKQIENIFSRENLVKKLLQMLGKDLADIKIQICYIFTNATEEGDPEKMFAFLNEINFMKYLADIIQSNPDNDLLFAALECVENMLYFGTKISKEKKSNPYLIQIYKLNASDKLEDLQYHSEDKIYEQVSKIIKNYFEVQDPLTI